MALAATLAGLFSLGLHGVGVGGGEGAESRGRVPRPGRRDVGGSPLAGSEDGLQLPLEEMAGGLQSPLGWASGQRVSSAWKGRTEERRMPQWAKLSKGLPVVGCSGD